MIDINNVTGDISIKSQIDREKISKISAQIQVTDLASQIEYPIQIANTNIEINIKDLNDNPPEFTSTVFNFSIYEDPLDVGMSILNVHLFKNKK